MEIKSLILLPSQSGKSAMRYTDTAESYEIARCLILAGASPNVWDVVSSLMYSINMYWICCSCQLCCSQSGYELSTVACELGDLEWLSFLVDHGATLNVVGRVCTRVHGSCSVSS